MNYFLKLLGKAEIKYFKRQNQCFNPPKKSLIKPKSLLVELPKKTKKRKFGKELQNLPILTDHNNLCFNQRKRNRNKNDIIFIGKRNNKCNDIAFCPKKIFNISNNNIISKVELNIPENKKQEEDKENNNNDKSHNKINSSSQPEITQTKKNKKKNFTTNNSPINKN